MNTQLHLLAVDTTGESCSCAILNRGEIYLQQHLASKAHSSQVLPLISQLLSQHGSNNLSALVLSAGPGSFTGLKIGASVIQALALAYNLPVILVPSLQVYAQAAWENYSEICALERGQEIIVATDARMSEFYFGRYLLDSDGVMQPIVADVLITRDKFCEFLSAVTEKTVLTGSNFEKYSKEVLANNKNLISKEQICLDLRQIFPYAIQKYEQRKFYEARDALPLYLRDAVC